MSAIEMISDPEAVSMHDDWFEIANGDHFWMQWRWKSFLKSRKLLPGKRNLLLEIGCGNGIAIEQIENGLDVIVDGCDLNLPAMQMAKPSKGKKFLYNIFEENPELINRYSGVVLLDVLEHISDAPLFLKTAAKHSKNDGIVLINVPAYQWLYSDYDKAVGHLRRYSKSEMKEVMIKAGVEPVRLYYWGALLIPIAIIRKIIIRNQSEDIIRNGFKPPGKLAHAFLKFLMHLESALPIRLPFGTSLIAIGKVKK